MSFRNKRYFWAVVSALSLLMLLVMVSSATLDYGNNQAGDSCVSCHVEIYNLGLAQRNMHWPFFNRQCFTCHVVGAASFSMQETRPPAESIITGTQVSQMPQWSKREVYQSSAAKTVDHVVVLRGLDFNTIYRFRIVMSETETKSDKGNIMSSWFGLAPGEIAELGSNVLPTRITDLTGMRGDMVQSLTLSRLKDSVLFIDWQTVVPSISWLELEETEGIDLAEIVETVDREAEPPAAAPAIDPDSDHPLLRDPEELTIDVCYSCHPGIRGVASHPVRIYATGDTRIPDDLHTINDGMITCATCHNPHGGEGKKLVREVIKTKLCVTCHYLFKGTSKSTMF
jgi:predicted CXXCH cytochrome family protein